MPDAQMLGKKFRVAQVLRGGMGEVYVGEFVSDETNPAEPGTRVALKTFQKQFLFDNAARVAFEREAAMWLRLSGVPHIMPALGLIRIEGRPFLVMPAVEPGPEGERSVADLLENGPLAPELVLQVAFQCAFGMRKAAERTEQLVHGDIKPSNILFMGGNAFLTDFGLASAALVGPADTRLEGTWAYLAPELWDGGGRTTEGDVYAFGVTLFEMLHGHTPFSPEADDRESWAQAHREEPVPRLETPAEWPQGLMELALECMAKDGRDRPGSFAGIAERLSSISHDHDPVGALMQLMKSVEMIRVFGETEPSLDEARVRGLLDLGDAKAALEALDDIGTDRYTPVLWLRRGTALSLLERDEEALEALDQIDIEALDEDDRINYAVERALSLKRVERYDEAIAIYEGLMLDVPDDRLPSVVVNLASVYLQQRRGEPAVELLEPFVRRFPDVGYAWANLGQAYDLVGRHGEAADALERAVNLSPQDGGVRVRLAAVQMDRLGALEHAWANLDAAFDTGHESREWLRRTLVCAVLLRKPDLDGLLYGLQNNFEPELAEAIRGEAQELIATLIKRFGGEPTEAQANGLGGSAAGGEDEFGGADDGDGVDGSAVAAENVAAGAGAAPDAADATDQPGLPFMNIRYYDLREFTLDYYQALDAPDYLDTFRREYRRMTRDPRFAANGATLRGSPFYVSVCPSCAVNILTNRSVGKQLRCRMCEREAPTQPVHGPEIDAIVAQVAEAVGFGPETGACSVCALHVVSDAAETVASICGGAGMVRLENDQLLAVQMHFEATRRGARIDDPWSVWTLTIETASPWSSNATPPAIEAVVSELQAKLPAVRTLSMTLSEEDAAQMSDRVSSMMEDAARQHGQSIEEGTAGPEAYRAIADGQLAAKQYKEAEENARIAVALDDQAADSWLTLGRALLFQTSFAEARDALERAAALDPGSGLTLRYLAACLDKLGDPEGAREVNARAVALGAPRMGRE